MHKSWCVRASPSSEACDLRHLALHFQLRCPEKAGDVGPQDRIFLSQAVPLRSMTARHQLQKWVA